MSLGYPHNDTAESWERMGALHGPDVEPPEPMGWACEGCVYYTEDQDEALAHCDKHGHSLAPCPRSRRPT